MITLKSLLKYRIYSSSLLLLPKLNYLLPGDVEKLLLQYLSLVLRYVPVKDLASIYKEFYGREIITEGTITDCTYLLFLEL